MGDSEGLKIRLVINTRDEAALTALREAVEELRGEGHSVEGSITFEGRDAERFAKAAVADDADLVIAAGGDGTVNGVVNGLIAGGPDRPAAGLPRLGIVPLGTANDLAGSLGLPTEVREAVRHALRAESREVDVVRVNDGYFLNVSTGGLGAEATEEAPARAKRAIGVLAYLAQGVRKFAGLTPSTGRFTAGDDVVHDGEFLLFAVGNGTRTGGGNFVTPRADMTDGLLDLCIVLPMSHPDFLRLLPDLRSGAHVGNENVIYRQLTGLTIESDEELSVNADGEPVDARRFVYAVKPKALRLTVPTREA